MEHKELKEEALQNKEIRKEYNLLEPEFDLLKKILMARKQSGLTQTDIAKRMNVKASSIARLESSLLSGKHSPSIVTLKRYAKALNCKLEIKLISEERA